MKYQKEIRDGQSTFQNDSYGAKNITIVIPCRNEANHIASCLDSIMNFDYDKSLIEVIVVDGMSNDGTREIIKKYCQLYSYIKLMDNPDLITPVAMNLGIESSHGEFCVILGVHTIYSKDYISKMVEGIGKHDADAFGGILKVKCKSKTDMAEALALSNGHSFSFGNSYFRTGSDKIRKVDTIPYGIYKKEVFSKIGLFNPKLTRGQDREFNTRLKQAGGLLVLDPSIQSTYFARSKFLIYAKWVFLGGYWVFYASRFTNTKMRSWRNYFPLSFLIYNFLFIGSCWFFSRTILWVLSLPIFIYWMLAIFFSINIFLKSNKLKYFVYFLAIFPTTHFAYAIGSFYGIVKKIALGKDISK